MASSSGGGADLSATRSRSSEAVSLRAIGTPAFQPLIKNELKSTELQSSTSSPYTQCRCCWTERRRRKMRRRLLHPFGWSEYYSMPSGWTEEAPPPPDGWRRRLLLRPFFLSQSWLALQILSVWMEEEAHIFLLHAL